MEYTSGGHVRLVPPGGRGTEPGRDDRSAPTSRGLAHYLKTGEGAVVNRRIEITALRRDGQELPVEVAITPLRVNGAVVFSAFLRDITARKEAEQAITAYAKQLEQINQHLDIALTQAHAATEAKSAFLATMSH
jgi:two-component system sensor histidine kinase/response regulator